MNVCFTNIEHRLQEFMHLINCDTLHIVVLLYTILVKVLDIQIVVYFDWQCRIKSWLIILNLYAKYR